MKFILLFLISFTISSQNLVQNPSFEIYSQCPDNLGRIAYATPWQRIQNHFGTSDYFNACAPNYVGLLNFYGNQTAYQGNAYAGIVTYNIEDYREYIYAPLTTTMSAGQTYFVSLYVSCSEKSRLGSNNIGVFFSANPIDGNSSSAALNTIPNVWSQDIITNTTGWTLISGTYIAAGNEQYISIGNFFNNANTNTIIVNASQNTTYAYYYVDQVVVSTNQMSNNDFNYEKITISPNPVADEFSFTTENNEGITQIELFNQYGKVRTFNTDENRFFVKDLPSGVYYLLVTYESGKRTLGKILKL